MCKQTNVRKGETEPAHDPLLNSYEVADLVDVDEKSLRHQRWRRRRNPNAGMQWEIVDGRPMYRLSEVHSFYGVKP